MVKTTKVISGFMGIVAVIALLSLSCPAFAAPKPIKSPKIKKSKTSVSISRRNNALLNEIAKLSKRLQAIEASRGDDGSGTGSGGGLDDDYYFKQGTLSTIERGGEFILSCDVSADGVADRLVNSGYSAEVNLANCPANGQAYAGIDFSLFKPYLQFSKDQSVLTNESIPVPFARIWNFYVTIGRTNGVFLGGVPCEIVFKTFILCRRRSN